MKLKAGKVDSRVESAIRALEKNGRFAQEQEYIQHGTTTVYMHSVNVALLSYAVARHLHLRLLINVDALIFGALLHDYFLYDWHEKDKGHSMHGFRHPKFALVNARDDFTLSPLVEDIIAHHMFPMVPIPPSSLEGWIVTIADKICATQETIQPWKKKVQNFHLTKSMVRSELDE